MHRACCVCSTSKNIDDGSGDYQTLTGKGIQHQFPALRLNLVDQVHAARVALTDIGIPRQLRSLVVQPTYLTSASSLYVATGLQNATKLSWRLITVPNVGRWRPNHFKRLLLDRARQDSLPVSKKRAATRAQRKQHNHYSCPDWTSSPIATAPRAPMATLRCALARSHTQIRRQSFVSCSCSPVSLFALSFHSVDPIARFFVACLCGICRF